MEEQEPEGARELLRRHGVGGEGAGLTNEMTREGNYFF
jgi:hypothetical protein